ncbi:MAG: hypothetical protein HY744_24190 [Deltaproteobacteria bacterium]|nr:hypothetical protein [Deltaproteobacteria bacterium]
MAAKCAGAETCEDGCSQGEEDASTRGCSDEFDAFLGCADDAPDACSAASACKSEYDAVDACGQKYCADNPQECGAAGGPPSGSGGGLEE